MQEASVPRYRRFVLGLHGPREVSLLLKKGLLSTTHESFKIGRNAIRIVRVVVVRVPVVVHITEVGGVARIRRTLPPVHRRTEEHFTAIHPHNLPYPVIFNPF